MCILHFYEDVGICYVSPTAVFEYVIQYYDLPHIFRVIYTCLDTKYDKPNSFYRCKSVIKQPGERRVFLASSLTNKIEFFSDRYTKYTFALQCTNITCTSCCFVARRAISGNCATSPNISTAKFIFPRRVVRRPACTASIDYTRMQGTYIQWSPPRQIFSIVHTEFLLDDRGDPGLWSECEQSRAKTSVVRWLEFLACAAHALGVSLNTRTLRLVDTTCPICVPRHKIVPLGMKQKKIYIHTYSVLIRKIINCDRNTAWCNKNSLCLNKR